MPTALYSFKSNVIPFISSLSSSSSIFIPTNVLSLESNHLSRSDHNQSGLSGRPRSLIPVQWEYCDCQYISYPIALLNFLHLCHNLTLLWRSFPLSQELPIITKQCHQMKYKQVVTVVTGVVSIKSTKYQIGNNEINKVASQSRILTRNILIKPPSVSPGDGNKASFFSPP
jgi:hypothetical protein